MLQTPRMCTGTRTAARTNVNGVMRESADSLILQKSNARTMKMRKSDLWLAFCAHQISWILWSKMKPCFWLGFCASWNCEFQWFQKSASRGGLPKKIDNHWKSIDGSKNFNVASSSRRMLFMRCNEDPCSFIKKKWKLVIRRHNVTYIRISLNLRR